MPSTSITISGELGSGKSSVARSLAARLGWRPISTGDMQRSMASLSNKTTLEVNQLAESDRSIDDGIDGETKRLAAEAIPTVFDSRMAWHFVPDAFKVHLVVAPEVGAERMFGRLEAVAESYETAAAATADAEARARSEQHRFSTLYGVDIWRLHNYDLVIDTSDISVDDAVAAVLEAFQASAGTPRLRISPRRVITGDAAQPTGDAQPLGADECPRVHYARPYFYADDDVDLIGRAIRLDLPLVRAELVAEDDETVDQDMN